MYLKVAVDKMFELPWYLRESKGLSIHDAHLPTVKGKAYLPGAHENEQNVQSITKSCGASKHFI